MNQKNKNLWVIAVTVSFLVLTIFISGCINKEKEVDEKPTAAEVNKTGNNQIEEILAKEKKNKPEEQMSSLELYCYLKCMSQECYDSCYRDFAYNMVIEGIKKRGNSYCDPDSIFNSDFINFCIQISAIFDRNISLCDKISDNYSWLEKEECVGLVAAVKKDISWCNEIEYDPNNVYKLGRDYCVGKVAKMTNDLSLCEKTNEIRGREVCIEGIAIKRDDVSLCDKIPHIAYKEDCIDGVAIAKKDVSLCSKMSIEKKKDSCFSYIAQTREDFTICQNVSNSEQKRLCVHMVAWVTKNSSICEEIKTQKDKEFCLADVGVTTRNASICDKITNVSIKNDCIEQAKLPKF